MDFRQRLEQSRVQPEADAQLSNNYYSVEWNKSPICLELRLPDGNRKAIPYSYFTEINFDADEGIEILTTQKSIVITGRSLATLFEHLVTYRVRYVQVNIGCDVAEDGLFISEILIGDIA